MAERGITLIALVITIIVILILAGVTIATLTGDNGLLQKATNAKEANEEASALEKIKVEVAGSYGLDGKIDIEQLNNNLKRIKGLKYNDLELNETNKITEFPAEVKLDGYDYAITDRGEVDGFKLGNSAEIAKDNTYIGKKVNYDVAYDDTYVGDGQPDSGWEILYADNKNVYIITKGYLEASYLVSAYEDNSGYNGTSDFNNLDKVKYPAVADGWLSNIYGTDYESEKRNMKAAEYILDSTNIKWKNLKNNKAKWVIGGPTLDLFLKAYNIINNTSYETPECSGDGYQVTNLYFFQAGNVLYHDGTGYWLACPVQAYYDYDLLMVGFEKKRTSANHAYFAEAFRPVVCLKSSVILTWNPETNQYDLT